MVTCEASGLDSDTESPEQEESLKHSFSEHALVTLVCLSELIGWKDDVTRVDVVFVFFSGINSLTFLLDA